MPDYVDYTCVSSPIRSNDTESMGQPPSHLMKTSDTTQMCKKGLMSIARLKTVRRVYVAVRYTHLGTA